MYSKVQKNTKLVIIICSILIIGFIFFDMFSMLGVDILTFFYSLVAILILLILFIINLILLFINRNFNLRGFVPLITILLTPFVMAIILGITPGNIISHEVGSYFFSRELINCPLPPNSEIILSGREHGNSSGTSNHCENLVYIAISSNSSIEDIKYFYENKLSKNIDKNSLDIRLYTKDNKYIKDTVFSFTEEQRNQLTKAVGQKKTVYIISVLRGNSLTCLGGH